MGCAPSSGKAMSAPVQAPELSGKSKFLSCPTTTEIQHPSSNDPYLLICYAPSSPPFGLVMAARNMNRRSDKVLIKDVLDADLVREKEQCKISMSWNVVFKAIATELNKANKGGATCVFLPDGSLEIEIRVSLTGLSPQSKRTDVYKCVLEPLDPTPQRVYKYFVLPMATYYGKKKSDLLEKPDPAKEKVLGQLEATLIAKTASIATYNASINGDRPNIIPLRNQVQSLVEKRQVAGAAVAMLSQLSLVQRGDGGTTRAAEWVSTNVKNDPPSFHADPRTISLFEPIAPVSAFTIDTLPWGDCLVHPEPITSGHPLLSACHAAEQDWSCVEILPEVLAQHGQGIGALLAYMLLRFANPAQKELLPTGTIVALCRDLEGMIPSETPFFSTRRAVLMAGAFLFLLCGGDAIRRLNLKGDLLTTSILAVCGLMVHHDGSPNMAQYAARTLLSSMYPEGALQQHAAAVWSSILQRHVSSPHVWSCATLFTLMGCPSYFDPPETPTVAAFLRRCGEIKDFSRSNADRTLAVGAAIALCSVCHLFAPDTMMDWQEYYLLAVDRAQTRCLATHGITSLLRYQTWWDDSQGAVRTLESGFRMIFPKISFNLAATQPGLFVEAPSFIAH